MKSATLLNVFLAVASVFVTTPGQAKDLLSSTSEDSDVQEPVSPPNVGPAKGRAPAAVSSGNVAPARLANLPEVQIDAYGADPTGVRSSCSAWTSALTAIPNGGTIHFGRGSYKLPCALKASNVSLRVSGAGASQSILGFTAPGGGFVVMQESHNYFTQFDNLKIQTVQLNQIETAAIWVNYTEGSHQLFNSGVFRDISIDGVNDGAHQHYWKYGVHCTGCDAGLAQNVDINGINANFRGSGWSPTSQMSVGVLVDGGKAAGVGASLGSNGFLEDHVTVYDSVVGTQFMDDSEGPVVINGNYVGVNHGVYAPDGANWPSFFVQNNAFSCYVDCVLFAGYQQGQIYANYAMKRPESSEDFICYVIADNPGIGTSIGNIISNNACSGFKGNSAGGTAIAVSLGPATEQTLVEANSAYNVDYFIEEHNGQTYNKITNNLLFGSVTSWINKPNYATEFTNNSPIITRLDRGWCPVSGARPNLSAGLPCKTFRLFQSGPTTVTDFLNGQVGQIAILTFLDNNSTLTASAQLALNNGVDWTPESGDTITFIKDTEIEWRELGRSSVCSAFCGKGSEPNVGVGVGSSNFSGVHQNSPRDLPGVAVAPATPLRLNIRPSNPPGTTSTVGAMTGLGVTFVPTQTGNVLITVTGEGRSNTAGNGFGVELLYGSGKIPGNGAELAGTSTTSINVRNLSANTQIPFTLNYWLSGLSVGKSYWLDLGQRAMTAGKINLYDLGITVIEM
ncbi:hypothetical protein [Methylocystis bryophila]|uniref:hypothetical protein n=1 Tax=Methylocystis bryophila TaxID=655015 RepID=UPI00131A1ACF|nr:hypothetical protein [Methylocystis bryophila]